MARRRSTCAENRRPTLSVARSRAREPHGLGSWNKWTPIGKSRNPRERPRLSVVVERQPTSSVSARRKGIDTSASFPKSLIVLLENTPAEAVQFAKRTVELAPHDAEGHEVLAKATIRMAIPKRHDLS